MHPVRYVNRSWYPGSKVGNIKRADVEFGRRLLRERRAKMKTDPQRQ